MGLGKALAQSAWQEKLRRALSGSRGIRLGEATVVSRQVHMSDPQQPELVTILTSADAGRTFYGRAQLGEVVHLDTFHEIAAVDHRKVAHALRHALAGIQMAEFDSTSRMLLDYFDLQTGVGGGRITGDLSYGQKPSLRVAHRNHVHVAGQLHESQLHLILLMASAIEESIRGQGVEIRRLERLSHQRGTGGGEPLDLSAYTDMNDTWLRGTRGGPPTPSSSGGPPTHGQGETQTLRSGRGVGLGSGGAPLPGLAGGDHPSHGLESSEDPDPSQATESGPQPDSAWDLLQQEQRLQSALELSQRLGSPDEVKRVLDELSRDQGWASLYNSGSSQAPFVIRQLEEDGLLRREIRGLKLTDQGVALLSYLNQHLRDVKLRFRKLIRRMPATRPSSRRPGQERVRAKASPDVRYGPITGTAPAQQGAWLGDIALPDTVRAGIRRTYLERLEEGGTLRRGGLALQRKDIWLHLRSGDQGLNICLLIDASASMAGRRILAAKHLARHLLVSTRDRIACIAFQEREVKVYVPFTRDWTQVEDGLARMQPLGLTPLAHGLIQSMELIRASKVRRPLLLLITDGIPTVPKWTIDPLADALEAARQVGAGRIPFGCIGLQPSRRYLEELVRAGGGTLHVVDELNEDSLISIAHEERLRTSQRFR